MLLTNKLLILLTALICCFFTPFSSDTILAQTIPSGLSATLSGTSTQCLNATHPTITFSASGGTGSPYIFTYTLNNGVEQTIISVSGNTASVDVPTDKTGIFTYRLKKVSDSFGSTENISNQSATITIRELPVITGASAICIGDTPVQLTAANSTASPMTPWISADPSIIAVSNSGLANGISAGNTNVVYTDMYGCSASTNIKVNSPPTIDFFFPDNQCSGLSIPFTSQVTEPGTYNYLWTFGDGSISTKANPQYWYNTPGGGAESTKNYSVSLQVTNAATSCKSNATKTISVKTALDPNLTSENVTRTDNNGVATFTACEKTLTNIVFLNSSVTKANITSYTLDWGDGSSSESPNTDWTQITHAYAPGLYTLKYTVTGNSYCDATREYKVFVGSNPTVTFGSPGDLQKCINEPIEIPILNTESNPPGTTYIVSFNDGSSEEVYDTNTLPEKIVHKFTKGSCGTNSTSGNTIYPNAFLAKILAQNPCGQQESTVVPIHISTPPKANYTLPSDHICTNTPIKLTNASLDGTQVSPLGTCSASKLVWIVTPNSGYTATGTMGNTNGMASTPSAWSRGSDDIIFTFTQPGNYTITMLNAGSCDEISQISKDVCVTKPLVPDFSTSATEACIGEQVDITNTTDITNYCAMPTFNWGITYTAGNCGNNSSFAFVNNTTATSTSPSLKFNQPGTYTLTLTTTNECGSQTKSRNIIIKQAPQALINGISSTCGFADITPSANINSCAPPSSTLTYTWTFTGGTPASSNAVTPGIIHYSTPGTYTVKLGLSNECGSSEDSQSFTIKKIPSITNTELSQTTCSGVATVAVPLSADLSDTKFSWVATGDGGLFGYIPSSTGITSIPIQTINSINDTQKKVEFSIKPYLDGCFGDPVVYTYYIDPKATITLQPNSETICKDGTPSPLKVQYGNSTQTPTYQWFKNSSNTNSGGSAISGANSDTYIPPTSTEGTTYYYCTITFDGTNCAILVSNPAAIKIMAPPSITTQPHPSQTLCVGGTLAFPLYIEYKDGVGTPSYQWYENTSNTNTGGTLIPGANASTYSPTMPYTSIGTKYYYATLNLSGSGSPTLTSDPATVNIVADPIVVNQPKPTQTICQDAIVDNLEVSASGGTGAFLYQWFKNTTNSNTGGSLIPGATNELYIPLSGNAGTSYYYCEITQIGGSGCNALGDVAQVIVKPAPTITTQPQSGSLCVNGTPSTLTVAYTDGVGTPSYQWFNNTTSSTTTGTLISGATENSYAIPPSSITGTTYYYCTISLPDGKCADITSDLATIIVANPPTISTQPEPNQEICVGASISTPLKVSYTDGAGTPSYQWYVNTANSNMGGTLIAGANQDSYTPPAFTAAGNYYYYAIITLSGNNCGYAVSNPATIKVVADPVVDSSSPSNTFYCQNATSSDLFVIPNGGSGSFNYQWYVNTTNSNTGGSAISGANANTYTPATNTIGTSWYYCKITQSGLGCDVTSSPFAVTITPPPTFSVQPLSASYCLEQTPADLQVTAINGIGTPTYQWFSNSTNSSIGAIPIASATNNHYTPSTSTSGTKYYYCVLTYASGGCSTIESDIAAITVKSGPSITDKALTIVSGGTFSILPTNTLPDIVPDGTTYTWTTPAVTPLGSIDGGTASIIAQSSVSQTLTNAIATPSVADYTLVPSANGCVGNSFHAIITVNPDIKVTATTTNCSCFGSHNGQITTVITGGVPFSTGNPQIISWSGPNGYAASTSNITNLAPGTYTLTVSDNGGFPYTNSYIITEPNEIEIATLEKTDIQCKNDKNGKIAVTASGGSGSLQYNWAKDGIAYSTSNTISDLTPATYEIIVTDANTCASKPLSFTITEPTQLSAVIASKKDVGCYGDATGAINISVNGGTPDLSGYNYVWSGPNGFTSTSNSLSGLLAGHYELSVTDKNHCMATLPVDINQNPELTIDTLTTPITCYEANNASIILNIQGGAPPYNIQWSNYATGNVLTNLSPGVYTATVTDGNNCQKSVTITIHEAKLFTINPVKKDISCYGNHDGSLKLNIQGADVAVQWEDGSTAGAERNNLAPGNYSVTITDGSRCIIKGTYSLSEPPELTVDGKTTNALDCTNAKSGAIDLSVSGGTSPYRYLWSNGNTTKDLSDIAAGTYIVTVTDANNCSQTKEFHVWRPQSISIGLASRYDYNCQTKQLQQIIASTVTGGIPPYALKWSSGTPLDETNSSVSTTQSGLMILTATDSRGCTTNNTTESNLPNLGINYQSADCNKRTYTFDAIVVDESTENYHYAWEFGDGSISTEKSPQHTYTAVGTQTVKLTVVGKSCTSNYQKTIIVEGPPTLTITPEPVFCKGDSVTIHVSGASSYKWNSGSTDNSITIKQTGDYSVMGITKQGCSSVLKFSSSLYPDQTYEITSNRDEITLSDPSIRVWCKDVSALYYLWSFGDSIQAEGYDQTHSYSIKKDGYFDINLMTINPYGCKSNISKRIWIVNDNSINTFTPNSDGFNDVFLSGWHVKIFNRNGIQIFEGLNGWDGTHNGKLVSSDTYYYIVYFMSGSGIKSKEGYVTLIR